jgi:nucleotide-binding universal stress UspA family protein
MKNASMNQNAAGTFSIVVGLGFTDGDGLAFDQAVQIARRVPRSKLDLVHVFQEQPTAERARQLIDNLRLYVNEKAATTKGLEGLIVGIHLRHGEVANELVQLATDTQADLIVVCAHKNPYMRSWVVGSTAEQLVASAPCAVLIATPVPESQGIHDPVIEPPCPDCLAMRAQTSGSWWCERHSHHAKAGHTFSYRRELPFAIHDSEVIPTGIAM